MATCVALASCSAEVEPQVTVAPSADTTNISGISNSEIFAAIRFAEERSGGTVVGISVSADGYVAGIVDDDVHLLSFTNDFLVVSDPLLVNPDFEDIQYEGPGDLINPLDSDTEAEREQADKLLGQARISLSDAIDAAAAINPGFVTFATLVELQDDGVGYSVTITGPHDIHHVLIGGVSGVLL